MLEVIKEAMEIEEDERETETKERFYVGKN